MKTHLIVAFSAILFFTVPISLAQEAQKVNNDAKQMVLKEQKTLLDKSMKRHEQEIASLDTKLKTQRQYWVDRTLLDAKMGAVGSRDRTWAMQKDQVDNDIKTMEYKIKEHESALEQLEIKKGELKLKVIESYGNFPEWWD